MEKEIFKDYEYGGLQYKVGNFGTIYGSRFKRPLKQRIDKDGYLIITMGISKRTSKKVHRLVAELFVPNPNKLKEVNHKDFNRENPRYDNLEWSTHINNVKYSADMGHYSNSKIGINNGRAILNEEDVMEIRKLYDNGMKIKQISNKYNVNISTIENIIKRKTWKHI